MARGLLPDLFGANNKLPLGYEQRLSSIEEKRRFARKLQEQMMQPQKMGEMVSGHWVPNRSGIGPALAALMAQRELPGLDREEAELVKQREADFNTAMNEMPDRKVIEAHGPPTPEGVMPQNGFSDPTPQDFMKWGGRMSQLGPQGQAIGKEAIDAGIQRLLPKLRNPANLEFKEIELPNGLKQNVYLTKDPANPYIPIGQPFKGEPKNPPLLDQRITAATELQAIRRKAADENRPLTAAEQDRAGALVTALNQMAAVSLEGGGAAVLDRTAPAGAPVMPGTAPPSATPATPPSPMTPPTPNGQGVRDPVTGQPIPPAALAAAKNGVGIVQPDGTVGQNDPAFNGAFRNAAMPPSADRTSPQPALTQPKAGQPNVTAPQPGATTDVDGYMDYRKGGQKYDPRNEPYLPQPAQPGMTVMSPGTGAQKRLNADVTKLGDDAEKANIPTFDDAWKDFREQFAKARSKMAEMKPGEDKRGFIERSWDKMRFGGGAGGPLGIYNSLPAFLTSPAGQDLRRSIERVKSFERHALFGATLTGNEKMSFEQMAGTLFGIEDAQLTNALGAMERQFEEKKGSIYGKYAPIVQDEYLKGRARNRPTAPRPWIDRSRIGGGVDG